MLAPVLALAVLVFAQLALAFRAAARRRARGRPRAGGRRARAAGARPRRAPAPRRARAPGCATACSSSTCRAACACRCRSSRASSSRGRSRPGPREARGERGAVAIGAVALLLAARARGGCRPRRGPGAAARRAPCTARPMPSRWRRRACSSGATATTSTAAGRPRGLRATESAARAAAERVARAARRDARLDRVRARAARPVAAGGARAPCACRRSRRPPRARAGIGFAQPVAGGGLPPRGRARAGRGGRGRRGGARAARLAVRVGRREPRRGRIRLLGPRRLRARRRRAPGRPPRRGGIAAARPAACRAAAGCCRAISSSWATRPTTSGSWSRRGWPSRRRTAAPRARRSARRGRLDGRRAGSCRPARPLRRPRAASSPCPPTCPRQLRALVARSARAEQLPPALLAAQLEAESGFDAAAPSRRPGAQGIAQFMPVDLGRRLEPAAGAQPVRAGGGDRRAGPPDAPPARARRRRRRRGAAAYNAGPRCFRAAGHARPAPTSRASCAASAARPVRCQLLAPRGAGVRGARSATAAVMRAVRLLPRSDAATHRENGLALPAEIAGSGEPVREVLVIRRLPARLDSSAPACSSQT